MSEYRNEPDLKREMNERVVRNIKLLLDIQGHSQSEFCKYCKDQYKVNVNQGNLSKLLNEPEHHTVSLPLVVMASEYLEIDIKKILWEELSVSNVIVNHLKQDGNGINENILLDAQNPCFMPYFGDYHCYFYSTVSDEKKILTGKIKILKSQINTGCRVELEIDTKALLEDTGEPYIKKYAGIMLISQKLDVCYCIVDNDDLGECNFIAFRYVRKLNNLKYLGGMAAVCTVSAGSDPFPTMHRMLISRKPISDNMMEVIRGNLLLNTSRIVIREEVLTGLVQQHIISENVLEIFNKCGEKYTCFEMEERVLRGLKREVISPTKLIAGIRAESNGFKYNKISKKLDENVLEFLKEIR